MRVRLQQRGLAALVAGAIALVTPVAAAAPSVLEDPEAKAHFQRAQERFGEQDYAGAIPELKAAYALEPNPMLLYAWAQAERLAGSCVRAVELYRRFLETNPDTEQRQLAEANLLDCEAEVPDAPPSDTETDDTSEDESDADATADLADTDTPRRKWYTDRVGGALAGSGLGLAIGGGILMGVARTRVNSPAVAVEEDYLREVQTAQRLNTAGVVVLSVGGALLVGAAIRYALVARDSGPKAQARLQPMWLGTGVGLRGRF